MIIRILKRTIIPFVFIFGHCRITTMLNIFEQDILKWSLYIDFSILNIEIITFNSDLSTTTAPTTDATTTMKTNDVSKVNVTYRNRSGNSCINYNNNNNFFFVLLENEAINVIMQKPQNKINLIKHGNLQ